MKCLFLLESIRKSIHLATNVADGRVLLLQAVIVHGMQLVDTWQRQKLDISAHDTNLQPSERSAAGMCV